MEQMTGREFRERLEKLVAENAPKDHWKSGVVWADYTTRFKLVDLKCPRGFSIDSPWVFDEAKWEEVGDADREIMKYGVINQQGDIEWK